MSTNRVVFASYGIALLMLACNAGGAPDRAEAISAVDTSPAPDSPEQADGDEQAVDGDEAPATPEPVQPDAVGLPCTLKALLATRCQGCHAADAKNGTPLLTRDNLLAVSKKDATMKVIERALLRATATEKPMPPVGKGEPLTQDELSILRDWLEQGTQAERCDEP